MNSVLSVIHPKLFGAGLTTMNKLGAEAEFREIVSLWHSVFNGVQVLSNRETPLHRDNNTLAEWYDLLLTVGPYRNGWLALPGIGVKLSYEPGTVVGLGGKLLQHGVNKVEGERVCIAYYFRANVQKKVNEKAIQSGWSSWTKWFVEVA